MGLSASQMEDLGRIADGLISLTNHQQEGARHLPRHLWAYDQRDFIAAALAMFVEWGELVNECQWKPWRKYAEPTDLERAKVVKEFGDVLHMLAWTINNLRQRFDIGPADIAAGFMAAHLENIARFQGQVEGREPPEEVNTEGFGALVAAAIPNDHHKAILSKIAEILEGQAQEGDDQNLEALEVLRVHIAGTDPARVRDWVNRQ